MNDKLKLIIFGLGGMVGSFLLILLIFWLVLSPKAKSEAQMAETEAQAAQATAPAQESPAAPAVEKGQRVPGGEVLEIADVLGQEIPLEPKVTGYGWANWGMSAADVLAHLAQDGVSDTVYYKPTTDSDFSSVVALNPDPERYKIEYRFYNDKLFHAEVFYSDAFKSNTFNSFLLSMMTKYGRPYEQYASVDEAGNVILHVKWDTEDSLIELVARPRGVYSVFIDSQVTLIQLEEARKALDRLP